MPCSRVTVVTVTAVTRVTVGVATLLRVRRSNKRRTFIVLSRVCRDLNFCRFKPNAAHFHRTLTLWPLIEALMD